MLNKKDIELKDFDPSEYLDSKESMQAYIDEAIKTNDAGIISNAVGIVARAQGMTELANKTGLSRETLYRTLSERGNPNLKTLIAVSKALDINLNINC